MKNCIFNILPRQSGKTTTIISHALNNITLVPSYIISLEGMKKEIEFKTQDKIRVFTPDEYITMVMNTRYNPFCYNLYIDEYLLFNKNNQQAIYMLSKDYVDNNIYIYTSPSEIYNKDLFDFVRIMRSNNFNFNKLKMRIVFDDKDDNIDFDYLYHSFLTDPNTTLYVRYSDWESNMSKEQFQVSIGRFFKGE